MEEVFNYITKFYFTKILLWICVGIALIHALKIKPKDKIHSILILYLTIELSLGLIDNAITPNRHLSSEIKSYYINYTNILICLIECNFFSLLHNKVFNDSRKHTNKILMSILLSLATLIVVYTFIYDNVHILRFTFLLGSLEFLFIFYLSIDYFIKVIQNTATISLSNRGSFWCFLGSLLYCSISAPFYIVGPNFPIDHALYDMLLPALLFYLPYSILFYCISIALKCKTPIWS